MFQYNIMHIILAVNQNIDWTHLSVFSWQNFIDFEKQNLVAYACRLVIDKDKVICPVQQQTT